MFQALHRSASAIGLGLALVVLAAPLCAAVPEALGTLRADGAVYLDRVSTQGESTLYGGDQVSTNASQATVAFLRGNLLVLDRQSRAMFQRTERGLVVNLERGGLSFTASASEAVRVETEGLILSRTGAYPSLAEVALGGDGSIVVAVHRGSLAVANLRPDPVVVEAGQYLKVDPPAAQVVGTAAHGKQTLGDKLRTFHIGSLSHAASVAVIAVAAGGITAAAIAIPLAHQGPTVSPSAP